MTTVCQSFSTVGRTQASTVMLALRSSELASGTVTQSFTPSNESALPNLPVAVRVAPEIVPVLPVPDSSTVLAPEASSKP